MRNSIAVIGLGYVGLPLAHLLASKFNVIGYDINTNRVKSLQQGFDITREIEFDDLKSVLKTELNNQNGLLITDDLKDIRDSNTYIITVPTPVDKHKRPDLSILLNACKTIGSIIKKDDLVIFESTVYPGATEDDCVPIIEKESGLIYNVDFFVGYSPERVNPGDKVRSIENVIKITSGSTIETAKKVDGIYASVVKAGTYLAPSIKVAEAAKVIENSQRDINIAFVNELAKMFKLLEIDTHEVLKAASTKWNFMAFYPGLVGGHCIGVDPYYLAQKAKEVGYHSEVILAGRRINDSMGEYVAGQVIKCMIKNDMSIKKAKVLMLGITFKENCTDVRNTKIVDVVKSLEEYGLEVIIFDPFADIEEVKSEYNLNCLNELPENMQYSGIVLGVAHKLFLELDLKALLNENGIIYDVKGLLPLSLVDDRL